MEVIKNRTQSKSFMSPTLKEKFQKLGDYAKVPFLQKAQAYFTVITENYTKTISEEN